MILTLTLTLLLANPTAAAPTCDTAGLTKNCSLFQERANEPRITFPDGTYINNPLWKQGVQTKGGGDAAKQLKKKADLLRIWNALPENTRPSLEFQIAFGQSLGHPHVLAASSAPHPAPHHESSPLLLPWPPTQADAAQKNVSEEELRLYLAGLPASTREALDKIVSVAAASDFTGPAGAPTIKPKRSLREEGERLRKLFSFATTALMEEILQGRKPSELSAAERAQYVRVQQLTLAGADETAGDPSCAKMAPDAYYSREGHKVIICPGMYHLPDAALVEVIGHEVAHPIDPCLIQIPLVKVDRKRLAELKKQNSKWTNPEAEMLLGSLEASAPAENAVLSALLNSRRNDGLDFLKTLGVVQVLAPGISLTDYPPKKTYDCLVKNVGIRDVYARDLDKLARSYAHATGVRKSKQEREQVEALVKKQLRRYPQCVAATTGKPQVGEAMSDAWSSRVLARWLQARRPQTDLERLAPMAMFLPGECRPEGKSAASGSIYEVLDIATGELSRAHPFGRERAEKIFLADKKLQEAIGCSNTQAFSCTEFLTPKRRGDNRATTDSTTGDLNRGGSAK